MPKPKIKSGKDLAYYVTLFKIEGHETYRCILSPDKDGFEKQAKSNMGNTTITERKVYRVDRITGDMKPYEAK